jgi:NAD(P)-dependent dehydrogenase (short-subunit alcohol dehydrogenase family)
MGMKTEGIALVTGASRGIGRAVAVELAAVGFEVVATMRNPADGERLAEEGDGRIRVAELDLDRPETFDVPEGLRVLVNNAGTERAYFPVEATPMEHWREVFETNVFGTVELIQRAIPPLRRSGGGVVCNVTSTAILTPVPFYSIYRASKAAMQALGETLRVEVAPFGIRVVEILPGPIATDMLAKSHRLPEAAEIDGYREMAEAMFSGRSRIDPYITPAPEAARAIVEAILTDDGPLRWGCDPMARELLAAWQSDHDTMMGVR